MSCGQMRLHVPTECALAQAIPSSHSEPVLSLRRLWTMPGNILPLSTGALANISTVLLCSMLKVQVFIRPHLLPPESSWEEHGQVKRKTALRLPQACLKDL